MDAKYITTASEQLSLTWVTWEGRTGRHNQLGTLITPAVLYGYTWSWTPVHQVMGSYIKLCWIIALRTSSRVQFSFI